MRTTSLNGFLKDLSYNFLRYLGLGIEVYLNAEHLYKSSFIYFSGSVYHTLYASLYDSLDLFDLYFSTYMMENLVNYAPCIGPRIHRVIIYWYKRIYN